LKVLVVGNNPIELGRVFDALQKIRDRNIMTEIAFDLKSILERLVRFSPHYILIDDNIGKPELKSAVEALHHERKTKNIPITILKSSNYHEAINTGVMNYVLKESLTGESLHTALKNSLKFKKTQLYLSKAYKKRKGQMMRLIRKADSF
jgi:ActR/RegA family two-component response regulator